MRVVRRFLRRLPNLNWISIVFTPVAVIMMEVFWFYPWLVWAGKLDFFADKHPPLNLGAVILLLGASYLATRYLLSRDWLFAANTMPVSASPTRNGSSTPVR